MAILDKALTLSEAQAVTSTGANASTNIIDFQAEGIHVGDDLSLVVRVNTTATSTGSATVLATIQTDTATGFTGATTIDASAAVAVASLVAGYEFLNIKVPYTPTMKRYMRVTYTVGTAALSAGKFDAYALCTTSQGAVV